MSDSVRINGNPHDWGSVILRINNVRYFGYKSVSWDEARTRTLVYGAGRDRTPRGKSAGKYEPGKLKLTVEKAMAMELTVDLAQASSDNVSYGNARVPICLQYQEDGQWDITEEFDDCSMVSTSNSNEEGPDPIYEEVEFQFLRHRKNGLSLYNQAG
jgi:hypothetical protein